MVKVVDVFLEGRKLLNEAHAAKEKDKEGTLRGGSSGALVGDDVIGTCHRRSLARMLGFDPPTDESSYDIFDAGFANEALWEEKLVAGWPGEVKFEEEIPIKWEVNGVTVSGRPDAVLMKDGKPFHGIELKGVFSYNTATSLLYEGDPKTDNLVQAAHYSWQLGVPYSLIYTYSSIAEPPYWAKKQKNLEWNTKIYPFKKEFILDWEGDTLYYTIDGNRHETVITQPSIQDYYELVTNMRDQKDLFTRPSNKDFKGNKLKWDTCKYCPFQSNCDKYEYEYNAWVDSLEVTCKKGD